MKAATIHEIKQELKSSPPAALLELCLRLAKYKKENKELLAYLLFEAHNLPAYFASVKEDIDSQFAELHTNNAYLAKKGIRKILKTVNKYVKYTASKQAEVELLIYFCAKLKQSGIAITAGSALYSLYQQQLKKIDASLTGLHEDLRHDYQKGIAEIKEIPTNTVNKAGLAGRKYKIFR